jgi:gliding motility-associated-like protein
VSGDFSSAWQLPPGSYSVTVTDNTSVCTETATFIIEEPLPIEIDYQTIAPVCYGDKAYLGIGNVENAHQPWQASILGVVEFGVWSEVEVQPGVPLLLLVKDAKGCEAQEQFIIPDKQPMRLELGEGQLIKYGQEIPIKPEVFPVDDISFKWTPTDGLSCSDCPNPIARPTESVTYRLRMVDSSGCELTDAISFAVVKSRDIFIPNAFSPNHDGVNDIFHPFGGFEIVSIKSMQVFDRWGGIIFNKPDPFAPNDPNAGWDGTARGKPLDTGAYLYQMNVEFIDGETVIFAGEVVLMR